MTDTKMKTELEALLLDLVAIANRKKPGQVTHKIEEIKLLFSKQEEQHRAEIEGLKMKPILVDYESTKGYSSHERSVGQDEGYNIAVDKFNKAITNLLEQKGK